MLLLHDYTKIFLLQRLLIIIYMINLLPAEEELALMNLLLTFNMSNEEKESREGPGLSWK